MYGPGIDGPIYHRGLGMMYGFGGGAFFIGLLLIAAVLLIWLVARPHRLAHANHVFTGCGHGVGHLDASATSTQVTRDPAEDIARERFARGEIDNVEFDRIVAALRAR